MARPKFAPKSNPSRLPIPKPHYLPHPWIRPIYDAKRHPDPIRRFSTMHWTNRPAHVYGPTDRPRESLTTIGRCATRATRPNNITSLNKFQMLTNVQRTTAAAVRWPLVTTYLTVTTAPVGQVTPVMVLPVQVRLINYAA